MAMDYEGTREPETEVALGDAALTRALPELAAAASAAAQTGGIPLVPDANNTVVLPQGATLDDITVHGRDLVIQTDDGRTYVIADGAVFVPQIVAQGVTVPPLNLAALLIGHEPEPAAGPVRSSGNNFAVPVGAIQDAYKIGNLLPYTELKFPEPQQREIFPGQVNHKPITGPNADVQLDDDSLPGGNPGGVGDVSPDTANTTGHLVGSGGDGALTWSLSTTGAPSGFSYVANGSGIDVFQGETKVIAITLDPATGAYTVTQLAPVMHVAGGDENNQALTLSYVVTDADGDHAAGTLGINVNDDTPIANPDTDTIAAGQFGPATGNVLTDAAPGDAGDSDNGADHVGADGGLALVSITGFGGAGTIGGTTQGHYGVLTLDAQGNYSYVRAEGTPGGVTDTFTYTIRDADGDTATTTLTITIDDARPVTGENALVQLDDDALAGGNPGGIGDVSPDTANTTGTLAASGGDGALTWALGTTGAPAGFSYVANGTGIDVYQGETKVIAVTLDTATGAYTVTQLAPVMHTPGGDENGQNFSIGYSVTDVDGDPASGTLTINVNDDTPTVSADGKAPALVVDETNLAIDATKDLSTLFTHSFGADGPAASDSVTYALGAVAGPSGLVDTLTGQAVNLALVSGVVEGRTTGGLLVFTLSVDGTGHVTLDQSRAVVHDPNLGPHDVATLAANLVTLTQTVSDSDGDHASASAAIGGMLQFVDDAPAAADDTNAIMGGETTATGNVITGAPADGAGKDTLGADGGSVIGVVSNNVPANGDTTLDGSGNLVVHGEFGTLTLNADGTYTYVRDAGTPGNSEDVFTYTIADGDGDKATATLTITIEDARPVTGPNALVQLDDDALAGGNPGGIGDVSPDTANT
ncbi:MAG: cadherin-like domain-containing protein, partial [Sphingomonadales bacterium]|nr:cadherin-like domain-containing protein [Sphingomonadales bacterium]